MTAVAPVKPDPVTTTCVPTRADTGENPATMGPPAGQARSMSDWGLAEGI